jgi:hypothetical protein
MRQFSILISERLEFNPHSDLYVNHTWAVQVSEMSKWPLEYFSSNNAEVCTALSITTRCELLNISHCNRMRFGWHLSWCLSRHQQKWWLVRVKLIDSVILACFIGAVGLTEGILFIGLSGFSVIIVLFRMHISGGDACFFTMCLFVVGSLVDLVRFVAWWHGWPGFLSWRGWLVLLCWFRGSLDVSQNYGPSRPVSGIVLPFFTILLCSPWQGLWWSLTLRFSY